MQHGLAGRFAGRVKGSERFGAGDWGTMSTGCPVLNGAVINLDCRVARRIPFETHDLFVGLVESVRTEPGTEPLLFVNGQWASLLPGEKEKQEVTSAVEDSIRILESARLAGDGVATQLDKLVHELTQVYIDRRSATRRYLSAEIYVSPEELAEINAARRKFDDKLVELLTRGAEQGEFDIQDARLTAFAITGMIGWVHRWFQPSGRLSADEVGHRLSVLIRRMVAKLE
jgi:AcrR family transcriptional regulator